MKLILNLKIKEYSKVGSLLRPLSDSLIHPTLVCLRHGNNKSDGLEASVTPPFSTSIAFLRSDKGVTTD